MAKRVALARKTLEVTLLHLKRTTYMWRSTCITSVKQVVANNDNLILSDQHQSPADVAEGALKVSHVKVSLKSRLGENGLLCLLWRMKTHKGSDAAGEGRVQDAIPNLPKTSLHQSDWF